VPASPLDRLDRKVTASVGDKAKAGIGEESPTSGGAGTSSGTNHLVHVAALGGKAEVSSLCLHWRQKGQSASRRDIR
jgi:hypothetical protein